MPFASKIRNSLSLAQLQKESLCLQSLCLQTPKILLARIFSENFSVLIFNLSSIISMRWLGYLGDGPRSEAYMTPRFEIVLNERKL